MLEIFIVLLGLILIISMLGGTVRTSPGPSMKAIPVAPVEQFVPTLQTLQNAMQASLTDSKDRIAKANSVEPFMPLCTFASVC